MTDSIPASTQLRWWSLTRLLSALVITPTVLIYQWGYSLIVGMMDGSPPRDALVTLGGGIAVVMLLTARLSPRLAGFRFERIVPQTVGAVWVAVTSLLILLRAGETMSRFAVLALFVPATLWVVWLAWMLYRPWSWRVRLGGLALCVALVAPFLLLLKTAGLTGGANVNFAWRAAPAELTSLSTAIAVPAGDENEVDLAATTADDFPQFLGPERTGVLPAARLSPDWQGHPPRELWRRAVGEGWGAFAVVGAYAVTQEQRVGDEAIVCYRVADGEPVWAHVYPARFDESTGGSNMGGTGPRATPTIVAGRVYALGATGILHCLEGATGRVVWSVDVQDDNAGHTIGHGVCGSPLVVDDLVIVAPTGSDRACLAAYDRHTGRRTWNAGRHSASYGSPALATLAGHAQILLYTHDGVEAHDVKTGEFLWNYTWTNPVQVNCSQPLIIDGPAGRVLLSTGYGTGSVLLEVALGSGNWSVKEVWKSSGKMKTKFTTAVRLGDCVYGLDDGILACVELTTGAQRWKGGRYQHGQILLAGDLLLVQAENGEVVLVQPDPARLIELGRIAALTGKTWNNLALAGKHLLVRNDHEAACYALPLAAGR